MRAIGTRDAAMTTARILLEIKAINFRPEEPYTFTSGWKAPVYIDCRRIIYFPRRARRSASSPSRKIQRHIGYESIEAIAGGETAGIPYAAWISDRMGLPMSYVRKKPKGFGRNALIEGDVPEGKETLLVEGPDDRRAIQGSALPSHCATPAPICHHAFVVFFYGVFEGSLETLAENDIALHYLATWWDVLEACRERPLLPPKPPWRRVHRFLEAPAAWSAARGGCHLQQRQAGGVASSAVAAHGCRGLTGPDALLRSPPLPGMWTIQGLPRIAPPPKALSGGCTCPIGPVLPPFRCLSDRITDRRGPGWTTGAT